jgi:multiple sugar transport system ATP-binding protein
LKDGVLQQVDSPSGIYDRPKNLFVAAFIGSPSMNLLWAEIAALSTDGGTLKLSSSRLPLPPRLLEVRSALAGYVSRSLVIGIRPEDIQDASLQADSGTNFNIRSTTILHFNLDAKSTTAMFSDSLDEILDWDTGHQAAHCIARLSARSRLRIGDPVEVAFDVERPHFFNGETGEAVR